MRSKFLSLNLRDFLKGLLLAVLTAVITLLYEKLGVGSPLDLELLKAMGVVALSTFLAYILKNLFTNTEGEILTPESK